MLAHVTNRAAGARGVFTRDRGVVMVEPGGEALLDLDDHPSHGAWAAAGEITLQPLAEKEARGARKRLDAEAEARARAAAAALADLPAAGAADAPRR